MNNIRNYLSKFDQNYFFSIPNQSKVIFAELTIYLTLIVAAYVLPRMLFQNSGKVYKKLIKNIFLVNLSLATIGLFLTFSRYELLPIFSWRIWQVINISIIILINGYYFMFSARRYKELAVRETEKERKEKWLPKAKKKRK